MSYVETPEAPQGDFRRPPGGPLRIGIWSSIEHRWKLVLAITLGCTLLGAAYGLLRTPTYESETRLAVGRINVSPSLLNVYVDASQALADQYSRVIGAKAVTDEVSRKVGISPQEASERLTATPVESTAVFRVTGTGTSSKQAIATANVGSRALIDYVTKLNRSNPDTQRLLRQYTTLLGRVENQRRTVRRIENQVKAGNSTSRDLLDAKADARLGALRLDAVANTYTASQAGEAYASLIQILTPASISTNDRAERLQIAAFVGLIVGLLLGAAVATLSGNRSLLRALTARA